MPLGTLVSLSQSALANPNKNLVALVPMIAFCAIATQ
jgi:hypothetical protein